MHLLRRRQADDTDVLFGASYDQSNPVRGLKLLVAGLLLIILTASASTVALMRSNASHTPAVATAATESLASNAANGLTVQTRPVSRVDFTPGCSQTSYSLPGSIDPVNLSDGVHYQIDPPASYRVYGNSITAISQQLYDCTPIHDGERFAANTGYNISSYFTYTGSGDVCSVNRATVTLHVNQVFPEWVNTDANDTMARTWNHFITSLQTHENGHVALDRHYAKTLYDAMMRVKNVNCDDITSVVNTRVTSVITNLNQANDNYDAATSHGATQGATL